MSFRMEETKTSLTNTLNMSQYDDVFSLYNDVKTLMHGVTDVRLVYAINDAKRWIPSRQNLSFVHCIGFPHTFIEAEIRDTQGGFHVLYVDRDITESFRLSKLYTTHEYARFLETYPKVFVGDAMDLYKTVSFLCSKMQDSLVQVCGSVGPWRRVDSVLSRWFSKGVIDYLRRQETRGRRIDIVRASGDTCGE